MRKIILILFLSLYTFLYSKGQTIIQLERRDGVYYLPCKVNGLSLRMVFDTGASAVIISLLEAKAMVQNGSLGENEILGPSHMQTASGDIIEGTYIIIRKIEIGNLILKNVKASVVYNLQAPLLLGQSVLSMLGKVSLNYSNNTMEIIPNLTLTGKAMKVFDVEQAQPMDGLFKYSTNLKEGMYNIPLYRFYDGSWAIVYRIPRYNDVHIIDDSNKYFAKVNVNGHLGYVLKMCLNPTY